MSEKEGKDEKASSGFSQMRSALKKNMYPDTKKEDEKKRKNRENR